MQLGRDACLTNGPRQSKTKAARVALIKSRLRRDAGSAERVVCAASRAGGIFDAVYISGAGLANATAGVPDVGLLTLTEVAQLAGYVAKAVKIPAIVDADTGFGGAENVGPHDL